MGAKLEPPRVPDQVMRCGWWANGVDREASALCHACGVRPEQQSSKAASVQCNADECMAPCCALLTMICRTACVSGLPAPWF